MVREQHKYLSDDLWEQKRQEALAKEELALASGHPDETLRELQTADVQYMANMAIQHHRKVC